MAQLRQLKHCTFRPVEPGWMLHIARWMPVICDWEVGRIGSPRSGAAQCEQVVSAVADLSRDGDDSRDEVVVVAGFRYLA